MTARDPSLLQDDAQGDPQWSEEQVLAAEFSCGGVTVGPDEVRLMQKTTLAVFTVLEKLWASLGVVLIDMKIEFGVDKESGEAAAKSGGCNYYTPSEVPPVVRLGGYCFFMRFK